MSQRIVPRRPAAYVGNMRQALAKLLLMFAIALMPFAMAGPASASMQHSPHAAMPMEHCPDRGAMPHAKSGIAECTMACAATLPAADRVAAEPLTPIAAPMPRVLAAHLAGLHPETATPPPRLD
ncbi:MAG: hypothetical protein ABIS38_07715 [Sphingomicrobium sp.]